MLEIKKMKHMQGTNNQNNICSSGVNHRQRKGMLAYSLCSLTEPRNKNSRKCVMSVTVKRQLIPLFVITTQDRGGGNSRGVAVSSLLLQKGRGKRSLMFEK